MNYTGEHLLPGQIGHFFIVLSLVASLVATFAYFMAARNHNSSLTPADTDAWKKLARLAFGVEVICVAGIFITLFYIINNHLFEYHYAWKHSSRSLELKYLLACFWEGQEGSFLLWSIWHCVLGIILIRRSREWEAPVMTVISFGQFALATMIAGIYFFNWKMGSNPFILLRNSGVFDNAVGLHVDQNLANPIRPDYMSLSFMKDGNDLNPLLQNYWMVIHPPVLFMGFASSIVPFGFAIAGIWKKKFGEWTKPALPWALFSTAVLGVGIMMGAMWAYESLTFGGYWAWDPVENASLVPWLILVSGVHTLLIYKHTGHSLRTTYLFFILAFGMVLYSTFLTRSGILGESSVHAFTDLGMNIQLYLLMYLFIWLAAALAAKTRKGSLLTVGIALALLLIMFAYQPAWLGLLALLGGLGLMIYQVQTQVPAILSEEENVSSREFWMFIGSLVFFLSAIVIIGKTSLPVYNLITPSKMKLAPPEDAEYSYNSIQVYVAVIVALLTAISQYLKYKSTSGGFFWKKMVIPAGITVIIAGLLLAGGSINYHQKGPVFHGALWLALICSIYAVVANAAYIWLGLKGKLKLSGGSIAHFGFGMVLVGILISSSNKEILSNNINGIPVPLGEKENPRENLTLVKGLTMDMGKYALTYQGDSAHPKKQLSYYKIHFRSKDGKEEFTLMPNSFVNYKGNEGLMSNPDARHYWNHDVFTYITSISLPAAKKDTSAFRTGLLHAGDTMFYSAGYVIPQKIEVNDSVPEELFGKGGKLYQVPVKVFANTGSIYTLTSRLALAKGEEVSLPDTLTAENLVMKLQKVNADQSIELGLKESNALLNYVTIKAYKFPYIRLLWLGVIITATGIIISMVRRIQLNRTGQSA